MLIIATQEDDDWLSKNLLETIKHDKTHGRMIENKFLLLMLLKVFFKFRYFFLLKAKLVHSPFHRVYKTVTLN